MNSIKTYCSDLVLLPNELKSSLSQCIWITSSMMVLKFRSLLNEEEINIDIYLSVIPITVKCNLY